MPSVNGFTYTTSSATSCTITNYTASDSTYSTNVSIPLTLDGYNVWRVEDNAFKNKGLDSVTFNHAITIGDNSFSDNGNLNVSLNQNINTSLVSSLTSPPFENCTVSLSMNNSVNEIDDYMFAYAGLTAVTLSTSVTTIRSYAFYNNSSLASLNLPQSLSVVEASAFKNCSIDNLVFDYDISLGKNCFDTNGTMNVTLNADVIVDGATTENESPFNNCFSVTLTIETGATVIDNYMFCYSGIDDLTLPASITDIKTAAFAYNSINYIAFNNPVALYDNCFKNNGVISLYINANITTDGVTDVSLSPFENCSVSATLSQEVTYIDAYLLAYSGLDIVTIPSSVTYSGAYSFGYNTTLDNIFIRNPDFTFHANILTGSGTGIIWGYEGSTAETLAGILANYDFGLLQPDTPPQYSVDIQVLELNDTTTAEAGTNTTNIKISGHGLSTGDFIVNTTRRGTTYKDTERGSRKITYVDADNFTVSAISGQTTGDTIKTYKYNSISSYVLDGSLSISLKSEGENSMSFECKAIVCMPGQYIRARVNSNTVFAGIINDESRTLECNTVMQSVNCVGYNNIPARRTVEINIAADTTSSVIVNSMATLLLQEGVTTGTISSGVRLEEEWINEVINIADVFDELASRNGFQWFIDKDLKLQFYKDKTIIVFCDYAIESGGVFTDFREVSVNATIDNYSNKIFVVGGTDNHGDLIYTNNSNLSEQNSFQEQVAGSGTYGLVHRDGALTNHDYKLIEAGSSATQVNYTAHKLQVGDWFWNVTRNVKSYVLTTASNYFTCVSVPSQASSDTIEVYNEANNVGRNMLRKQGFLQETIDFKTFNVFNFIPQTKLTVSLTDVSCSGIFCIEEVNISDEGAGYLTAVVRAIKRQEADFSTQKSVGYIDYFRGL